MFPFVFPSTDARGSQVLIDTGSVDLGSCSDPTILFKNGLDGRNTPAFIAQNQKDFKHGSVQGIKIITDFITQRLSSPCNAGMSRWFQSIVSSRRSQAESTQVPTLLPPPPPELLLLKLQEERREPPRTLGFVSCLLCLFTARLLTLISLQNVAFGITTTFVNGATR